MLASAHHEVLAAVGRFEHAAPELALARSLEHRRDWKFLFPLAALAPILQSLSSGYQVLLAGGEPLAQYETCYFDTATRHCYREHHRGRSRRFKVRIRSYLDRELTHLEVKVRDARRVTRKHSLARAFGDLEMSGDEVRPFVEQHSGMELSCFVPSLRNSFRRVTLLGVERCERITFDLGLRYRLAAQERGLPSLVVAEVKSAERRLGTRALAAFRAARMRPVSFSKYCVGLALVVPGLGSNRFRPVLRRLARIEEQS